MSRSRRQTAAFSLFTFLDVMLCTLGALIIVLICVVRTAQIKNAEETPQAMADVEEIAAQRDTVQWRAKHLETSREQTRAQLSDRRLELSHIEEHSRRLRLQLSEMEAAKKGLAEGSHKKEQFDQLRAEVDRVSQLAAAAERDLDDARREAETKRPSYAVVPYEGPSQTMRRPLYIECTGEHIILQPENIELSSYDFAGPLGPGNPLAAGLRAAREYLDSYKSDNIADAGEPYPLLLVRPDGVEAYYVAREAMTSWGSEFGYELIDQDWKLEFREPQPAMVEAMRLAVDEARMRQQALARAAPRYFSEKKGAQWYRAAPSGGVVQESGPSEDDVDRQRNSWAGRRGGGRRGGGYANQGNGGRGNGNGGGNGRGAASGRYPSNLGNGSGTGGSGDASTNANSDAELTSIYGAAANTAPGGGLGSGAGNSPTGALQGSGYGNPSGGINPGGNGAGNNMLASGQGAGGGAGVDNGSGDGSGTSGGNGLGLSAGGGDSLLASGSGNSQSPTATLPGAAGSGSSAPSNTGGAPGAAGTPGALVAGFNGQPYGSGTSTALGAAGGQAMASSGTKAVPGAASAGTTSAPAGNLVGNGTTGGDGVISNVPGAADGGTSGQPGGQAGGQPGGQPGSGPAGKGSNNQTAKGKQGQQGAGGLGMQPNSQAAGAAGGQAGGAASGQPGSPGGQAGMMPAAGNGQSSPMMSPSGPPSFQLGQQGQQPTASNSMADSRGKNWGLPEEARHAVPITRPVRVECRGDRLVLQTDQNPAQTQEIPLTERTEDSVEDLVSAVWKRVDTWGSAGRGMYWRPQLTVDVAPGGEARYADLQTLLADSGLEVKPAAKAPVQAARPKRKTTPW